MPSYDYLDSTGIVVVDTNTTLQEVQTEFKGVFGEDLDLTPSTPQGRLISTEVLSRDGNARLMADVANQFNPNMAGGIFLDAICGMMGLSRTAATRTTVTATLTGTSGTIIYAGATAQTTAGDIFELTTTTTIPVSGTIDALFQSVELGAIPCAAGTLTTIIDSVLGWTGITNAATGTLGTDQQSDLSLSTLRRRTLALQGVATNDAITSALYATSGVQSLQYRENVEATTQIIDTISMVAHSIYVCVYGGTDADVAQAIISNKSAGSAMNGTTSVPVTMTSGQIINVLFDRPTAIPILIKLNVKLSASASGTVSDTIKQAVLDYTDGLVDGEDGFTVGSSVSPFELAGAANGISGVYVQSCEIALASTGIYQSTEIAIAINEIATTTLASITVTIL